MRILIPGLKAWPYHHAVEHFLGEALRAAGHEVLFLGCHAGMGACECVDRAVFQASGGHAAFCAGCLRRQGGVHQRAGFRELTLVMDEVWESRTTRHLEGLDAAALLELPVLGHPLGQLAGPSLRRWARSGRPLESLIPLPVLRDHARLALRMAAQLPALLRREGVDMLLLLNGLFLAERVLSEAGRALGLRVVNYERGHARNTFVISDGAPACFLDLPSSVPPAPEVDDLADRYLEGRAHNRDASTRFGTGVTASARVARDRPLLLALANVCWDSAVCSRPDAFGGYLAWLEAVLREAARRPEVDVVLRVHPGEAKLTHDPTLDRTEAWLAERTLPANLRVVGAEDPESTYALMDQARAGVVYSTSAGLELAMRGVPVVVCGPVHYAGKGFTLDLATADDLPALLDQALATEADPTRAQAARRHAGRLFLDGPTPFPWVDEVEYGRPQRVAAPVTAATLARDPLLSRLVGFLAGGQARPHSLRDLLEDPALCPLPFHFGSRSGVPTLRLAVLIPAHGRPDALRCTLEAWLAQEWDGPRPRILVVDDGSHPPLEEALRDGKDPDGALAAGVEWLRLDVNGGPARARNRGLNHLLETDPGLDRILLTGDDMIPEPGFLARLAGEHAAWNDGRVALLARVDWDMRWGLNRVMRLVERNGLQFAFPSLPARAWLPATHCYTSALALPVPFLRATGLRFSEDFPHAAWEDVEFGARALERGMVLAYDAALRVRHDHPTDYASFALRQRKAGECSRVFRALRPRDHAAICGAPPADPPDRLVIRRLEAALEELSKLDLHPLEVLPGPDGKPHLAAWLDREQDRLLETLFQLHSQAGWFARPELPAGDGEDGLLSVLIPVYHQPELTAACLDALAANTRGPWEAMVVDNGSDEATRAVLKDRPGVRVLRNERNLGFARATNQAAAAARGALLCLLNNDTEVQPGWDLALRDELARPATGIVGLRLLYPDGTIQHAGLVFGPDHLPWHVYRGFPEQAPEVVRRRSLQAVTGACLGIPRRVWREVGGLDENYINCYEDIDLCLKVRRRGLEVVYRPDGVVVHHEGRSEGRGDHVRHSWLVLQDAWKGRLPHDEDEILAPDGWEAVRAPGSLTLRRRACGAGRAEELRVQAEGLFQQGRVEDARALLEGALAENGRLDRPAAVRRALLELELRVGNLQAARRWAGEVRPTVRQVRELERQSRVLQERMEMLGLGEAR